MKKLLLLIVVLTAGGWFWYQSALGPVDSVGAARKKVTIESGWSTMRILEELESKELIRSPMAFKLYLKLSGQDGSLQAGVFLLDQSQSVADLIAILQTGKAEEISVTIPEGFTVKDIDDLLTELELIEEGQAVACANTCDFSTYTFLPTVSDLAERGGKLEGYIFPDTYYVPANDFVVKFFFERMLNAFRKSVVEGLAEQIETSGRSLHELVTMASLVEEETRKDDERGPVSGILWKRYDADWGLGVDAAVRYIVNKPSAAITHADLNVNSPYNLRKFRGLPPGPIASISLKSMEATLNPEQSAYWYYLHDKTGQIHYSATNEEHNTKRYMYLGGASK